MLPDESPALVALQSECHVLWDACMRILTAPRTRDQEAELRLRLQEQIDACEQGRLDHDELLARWSFEHILDPLSLFKALLCLCLSSCLYGLDPSTDNLESTVLSRARDPRKRFRSSTGSWPTDPWQLFPYGPTQTLSALVDGCLADDDIGCWAVLNAVMQLARPRVWPVLIADDALHIQLCFACLLVISHGTDLQVGMRIKRDGNVLRTKTGHRDRPWLRTGRGRTIVAGFLQTVREGPYARPDDMYDFLRPCMKLFRDAHGLAMHKGPGAGADSDWSTILLCLTPASAHVLDARRRVPDDAVLASMERDPRRFAIMMVIQLALAALYSAKHCSGPACTRTMLDEENDRPSLPTCARCKLARYCSRECQRADWGQGHRSLCRIFAALERVAPALTSQREYGMKIQSSDISDEDLALVGQWAVSASQHYRDIIRTDMVYPMLMNKTRQRGGLAPVALDADSKARFLDLYR